MGIKTFYTIITLNILTLNLFFLTDHCTGGGAVVGDFFGIGGVGDDFSHWSTSEHSMIFLSGCCRRF